MFDTDDDCGDLKWPWSHFEVMWHHRICHQSTGNVQVSTLFCKFCSILHCFRNTVLLLLHPFNWLSSKTTWVSRHQKRKPSWILLEQEMMGWQWHQLDHMQIICTSLQTDNYASTSPSVMPKKCLFHTQPLFHPKIWDFPSDFDCWAWLQRTAW